MKVSSCLYPHVCATCAPACEEARSTTFDCSSSTKHLTSLKQGLWPLGGLQFVMEATWPVRSLFPHL